MRGLRWGPGSSGKDRGAQRLRGSRAVGGLLGAGPRAGPAVVFELIKGYCRMSSVQVLREGEGRTPWSSPARFGTSESHRRVTAWPSPAMLGLCPRGSEAVDWLAAPSVRPSCRALAAVSQIPAPGAGSSQRGEAGPCSGERISRYWLMAPSVTAKGQDSTAGWWQRPPIRS